MGYRVRGLTTLTRVCPDAARRRRCEDPPVATKVLIVDDFDGFRRTARALLEADGFEVVGEAADGQTAVAEAGRLQPAVVLLDVQLPDIDGFAVAERLAAAGGAPAIVLVSSHDAASYRRRLERSPVRGFIPKAELSGDRLVALLE
jgi:DNA-binding NarL/FixJ family response regulator